MKPWSTKVKRVLIGLCMFYGFICFALTINFYFVAVGNPVSVLMCMYVYYYMYLPALLLIILSYYMLTKVFPYGATKHGRLENNKVHTMQKS